MKRRSGLKNDCLGFTLIEVIVACVIITILGSITIAGFAVWLPGYRLKTAARDLYSNMQQVKMSAIKNNGSCTITFSLDQYVTSGVTKIVILSEYGSGVRFARSPADPGPAFPVAPLTFTSRGTCGASEAHLSNEKNSAYYKISTSSTGIVRFQKHVSGTNYQ